EAVAMGGLRDRLSPEPRTRAARRVPLLVPGLVVQRGEGALAHRAAAGDRREEAQGARRADPDAPLRGRRSGQARRLQHARRGPPRAARRLPHGAAALFLEFVSGALTSCASTASKRSRSTSR